MSSPEHAQYQEQLIGALRRLSHNPDLRRRIHHNAHAIAILYTLDLQPAHLIIAPCYAIFPRGGCPWQPVAIFHAILQHASVWVSRHDAQVFIADILGEQKVAA